MRMIHLQKGKHIAAQVGFVDTFNELVDRATESGQKVESVNGVSGPVYIVGEDGTDVKVKGSVIVIKGGGGGGGSEVPRPWHWNGSYFEDTVIAWGRCFCYAQGLVMPAGWDGAGSSTVILRVTHPTSPGGVPSGYELRLGTLPITNDLASGYTDMPIARFTNGQLTEYLIGMPVVPVYV